MSQKCESTSAPLADQILAALMPGQMVADGSSGEGKKALWCGNRWYSGWRGASGQSSGGGGGWMQMQYEEQGYTRTQLR